MKPANVLPSRPAGVTAAADAAAADMVEVVDTEVAVVVEAADMEEEEVAVVADTAAAVAAAAVEEIAVETEAETGTNLGRLTTAMFNPAARALTCVLAAFA